VDEMKTIDRIKHGDRQAMDTLINAYYQSVFAYFYHYTAKRDFSMDLTQEVFIKVITTIGEYQNKGKLKSWLFTIAVNHLRNHWKYQSRHYECEFDENSELVYDSWNDVSNNIDIHTALSKIPSEQREAIILKYYLGFTSKEISKMIRVKEPTVKARIQYGLQKLKRLLGGDDNGER